MYTIDSLLEMVRSNPEDVSFDDCIAVIDANYEFTPTAFRNGMLVNNAGENNGSCKIFAFAKLHGLDKTQTLHCFGDYYRKDVLGAPDGDDHQNIRNFMQTGWSTLGFDGVALAARS